MSARLLVGDAAAVLPTVAAGSVQLCVTSPPYLGLRDYGQAGQIGLERTPDEYVERLVSIFRLVRAALHPTGMLALNLGDSYSAGKAGRTDNNLTKGASRTGRRGANVEGYGGGIIPRNVDGVPPGNLLGIPWRVAFALQRDGWILRSAVVLTKVAPMPESVSGARWERCRVKSAPSRRAHQPSHTESQAGVNNGHGARDGADFDSKAEWQDCPGCPRCEANGGLVLRWGSGRPSSAYEMLFLLAKGPRYYWDCEAVRVPLSDAAVRNLKNVPASMYRCNQPMNVNGQRHMDEGQGSYFAPSLSNPAGRNAWNYQHFEDTEGAWGMAANHTALAYRYLMDRGVPEEMLRAAMSHATAQMEPTGDAQNVWSWRPSPFSEAHFATFPVSLPTWCIKAGTPEQCCAACGMPHARVIERDQFDRSADRLYPTGLNSHNPSGRVPGSNTRGIPDARPRSLGWRPTCPCNAHPRPALVLDPFAGAGTTLLAADRLGRDSIGIELSEEYAAMSRERLKADAGLFSEVE